MHFMVADIAMGCVLHDTRENNYYDLNLSAEQCKAVEYTDGIVISINLSYPHGAVVESSWDGEVISVRLIYVGEDYKFGSLINSENFLGNQKGFDLHRVLNQINLAFLAEDGELVTVRRRGSTWLAERMIKGVLINYQYKNNISDLKEIDRLVRYKTQKIIADRAPR